ncbi:MAG: ribbon-helix-helix domain-containing protein [Bacteroidetes bacterium]|nr:ribbon-helix-helix domain-containing protein [Bacteroidota bacterium]MCL5027009.1 ribbon-helix-helix domain-containing protein [Chloroflexota bacterium]
MAKVMVSIPDEVLKDLDAEAKAGGYTRSALLTEGARRLLRERKGLIPLRDRPEVNEAVEGIKRMAREDRAQDWDSTAALRQLRASH